MEESQVHRLPLKGSLIVYAMLIALLFHQPIFAQDQVVGLVRGKVSIELAQGGSVAASHIKISLTSPQKNAADLETFTNKNGFYYFRDVEVGSYTLGVWPNPLSERPELEFRLDVPAGDQHDVPQIYIPFSGGDFIALGRNAIKPISLDFSQKFMIMIVVTSPEKEVFKVDAQGSLKSLGELRVHGFATGHCLVEQRGSLWVASVSNHRVRTGWINRITLTPMRESRLATDEVVEKSTSRIGRYQRVAYDPLRKMLLITDPVRQGVYAYKVAAGKITSDEIRVVAGGGLEAPVSVAVWQDHIFIADIAEGKVFGARHGSDRVDILIKDLAAPSALAVSKDGKRLFVADSGSGSLIQYDRETKDRNPELDLQIDIREPVGLVFDSDEQLWIADRRTGKIFNITSMLDMKE